MNALPAKPTRTPTAPGGLPLIGHAHHLARRPLPFITSLRGRGSVVRIRIGPTPAYVVTDPALTRRVLVTDGAHFGKGGKVYDALRVFMGDGLATVADGDTHMRNRRLMQPMFNKAHIATRCAAMIEHVRTMVEAWPEGEPRNVFADMNDIALAAFLVALFGTDLPDRLQSEFTALMPPIMKGTIRQTILPPWLARLPLPANRAHAERVSRLRALIDLAIDHHAGRAAHAAPAPADASEEAAGCPHASAGTPEQAPERTPAECPAESSGQSGLFTMLLTAEDPFTRKQLQDEAITLLAGAIETTGTTLAWTLYEISRHPEIERRLRAELAAVCADRPLRHEDLEHLPYARTVLQEAVRMYGPSWFVTRTATRDIDLGGHRIPEGADVVWSPYLHQHDPDHFPDPDVFDPQRWTPERAPSTRRSFYAFGDGRRKCIGENFAWTELQIILATVLQRWNRLERVSRPPRAQAVITVRPDVMTMAYHDRAPSSPANRPGPVAEGPAESDAVA